MKRRTLLKLGLSGGALLALGGVGLSLRGPGRLRSVPPNLKQLSERQYLTLAAVAARVCPQRKNAPSTDDVQVAQKLDLLLETMHPADSQDFKQLLNLFDNALAGLLLDGRITTFTGASAAVQDEILQSWRTSTFLVKRTGYKAMVGLCAATYFGDPSTYASVGYPGPPDYGNVRHARQAS